jgi:hypothetical protein
MAIAAPSAGKGRPFDATYAAVPAKSEILPKPDRRNSATSSTRPISAEMSRDVAPATRRG